MDEREALLASLRDPLAPAVGWWPPAPGWWIVAALVVLTVAALAFALRRRARRRRDRAWQRSARTALATSRERLGQVPAGTTLAEASVLARRVLLAVRPRADVAALANDDWLRALDAASGGARFTRGEGRLLARGPYERAPTATEAELAGLLDALDSLIEGAGSRPFDTPPEGTDRAVAGPVTTERAT